jgi:hypothetical protein
VTARFYDVVVLGRSLGALTAAALLARRDFRVLVLGQGARAPSYRLDRHVLCRSAFTLLVAQSPAFRRVLIELAQSQTFRRRLSPLDPMVSLLLPERRFELPPDAARLASEVDREMPEVRRVVDELYGDLAQVNAAADQAFEKDAVWPPGTFWERRETQRLAATLPWARAEPGADLLAAFPPGHPYRAIVSAPAELATALATNGAPLPPFALARLHGSWTRGLWSLSRGEDELAEFLLERIEAHGGTLRLDDRAARILVRGGVSGVLVDGDLEPVGASFVVCDAPGETIADLTGGEGIHKRAEREWPRVTPGAWRWVASLVAARAGLPEPLGGEAFLVPAEAGRPTIHLVRTDLPEVAGAPPESRLVAEMLLPVASGAGAVTASDAREHLLASLSRELPFLARHLRVLDSPHDGRPVWIWDRGERREVERSRLEGGSLAPEPMRAQWSVSPAGWLGLGGEPVRGPVERTLLVGPTVLPALGQEGELLAAWSAARLVTRSDRHRERVRRAMWSKVEIG